MDLFETEAMLSLLYLKVGIERQVQGEKRLQQQLLILFSTFFVLIDEQIFRRLQLLLFEVCQLALKLLPVFFACFDLTILSTEFSLVEVQ